MEYTPGICNIGPAEIKRRYRIGYIGLMMMFLFVFFVEIFDVARGWKLFLFVPAYYALSGFIQARQKFCYVYGFKGTFRMAGRHVKSNVTNQNSLRKDQRMAFLLISKVVLGSSVITLVYYFSHSFFQIR